MKVLTIGDVHIKVNNVPEIDEMTNKLIELTKKEQPDFVVLLGDVLDRHSTIHVSCLMRAEKLVLSLSEIVPTFVLVGNHDRPNNSNFLTDEHPFNAMKLWNNTYIIDTTKAYTFSNGEILESNSSEESKNRFVFVPYVPPGRFNEALSKITSPLNCEAIFGHQEIENAKLGAIVSKEGDKWPLENPLLISGHIHDYDLLQPNMIYTGVPLMHSFGDKPDKTVSMFTFFNSEWKQERIDLGLIKKVIIYLTPEQLENYSPPKDKLVKLVIKGDEASIKTAAKLDKVQELKKQGVKVVFKTQIVDKIVDKPSMKISFEDRLKSEITNSELLWFNKIFSK